MINIEKIKELDTIKLLTKKGVILKKNFQERKINKKNKFIQDVLNDLENNHNHSWYDEIYSRNKNNLNDIALFYRGNEITYEEMFANMEKYAKSLKQMGLKANEEIPICISNTPEFVYLLGAISMLGLKANIFASDLDPDYTVDIINSCDSDIIFIEDRYYEDLKELLPRTKVKKVIMPSITSSLSKNSSKYADLDKKHGLFINNVPKYKKGNENILSIDEFVDIIQN